PQQITVSAHVIEPMVVHTGVAHMRSHERQCLISALLKKLPVTRGVKLQNGRTELERLGPFRPTAGGILTIHCKYGRTFCVLILVLDSGEFFARKLPKPL